MMKFIAIMMGALVLSTALLAVEPKDNPLPKSQKVDQEISPAESLKLWRKIHNYNTVFDDYSQGGIPYDAPKKYKKENKYED